MIILTIRTDKPESEIGIYQDDQVLVYEKWEAHRQLAESLHNKIQQLINSQSLSLNSIEGVVCFLGPGSYTGLRIGLSVANSISYALGVPIAGAEGEDWQKASIAKLKRNAPMLPLVPNYGGPVHTTKPLK